MSSLSGLPPIPTALHQVIGSLALPPTSLDHTTNSLGVNNSKSGVRQNGRVSSSDLDMSIGELHNEMKSLRQMDLSLFSQLLSLQETIHEVKQCLLHERASSETNSTCSSRSLDLATLDNIEEQPEYENLKFPINEDLMDDKGTAIYENIQKFPRRSHTTPVTGVKESDYLSPGDLAPLPYDIAMEIMSLPPPPPVPTTSPPHVPVQASQKKSKKSSSAKSHRHSMGQKQGVEGGKESRPSSGPSSGERKSGKSRRRSAGDAKFPVHPGKVTYKQSEV